MYRDIEGCILIVRIRPSSNFTTLVEQWFEVHSLEYLPPLREFVAKENKKCKNFVRGEIKWQDDRLLYQYREVRFVSDSVKISEKNEMSLM